MIYLDTSAAVPMFVPEPASPAIDAWFESCTAAEQYQKSRRWRDGD